MEYNSKDKAGNAPNTLITLPNVNNKLAFFNVRYMMTFIFSNLCVCILSLIFISTLTASLYDVDIVESVQYLPKYNPQTSSTYIILAGCHGPCWTSDLTYSSSELCEPRPANSRHLSGVFISPRC